MSEDESVQPDPDRESPVEQSADHLRTIVQASHLNFLIGAGTSASLFEVLGDVENVLTEVAASRAADRTKRLVRASVQAYFFAGVIEPNLQLLDATERAETLLASYAQFGRVLNRLLLLRRSTLLSKKVSLFTTNVDLAFEVSFERLGLELNDGFAGKLRPGYDPGLYGAVRYRTGVRYEHRSEVPTFDLLKLHGSVGWRLTDDSRIPSGIEFDTNLNDVKAIRTALDEVSPQLLTITRKGLQAKPLLDEAARIKTLPAGIEKFTSAYDRLVIVNPEKQKFATTVMTETYYELIRRFANELERENSVLFVHGFSFRDEHLRKIVIRAARTNPTLQVEIFCHTEGARKDLQALIGEDEVPNTNIAYLAPPSTEVRFTLDEVVKRYFAPMSGGLVLAPNHVDEVATSDAETVERDEDGDPRGS